MSTGRDVEALTQDYGRELFARIDRTGPLLFTPAWWNERLMEWTMGNTALKVQLFRFIDCLPLLRASGEISRHLREYFEEGGDQVPGWVRAGVHWLPERGMVGRLAAAAARRSAESMARRFIAGSNVTEVLRAVAHQRRRALAFTVDLLGEATITEAEADQCLGEYLRLILELGKEVNAWPAVDLIDRDDAGPLARVNVSVKLSALYSQFDPIDPEGTSRAVLHRLRPILRAARHNRAFVNFDMEQYAHKDLTLHVFRRVLEEKEFRDWADVGVAIQAYLRDTPGDLECLAGWAERRGTPIGVRLVKGAYWDYETIHAAQEGWPSPVFTGKWESDVQFERLTRFLMERHDLLRPALGSHNVRSLAHAMALADDLDVSPRAYEIQMLYGMADPIKTVLVGMGRRVRVYTPYGRLLPGMAYLVRRLLENTANESFLRASFTENVPEEQLLMKPQSMSVSHGPTLSDHSPTEVDGEVVGRERFRNEPVTDFSKESSRRAMAEALREVAAQFGRSYPLVIDGRSVDTQAKLAVWNPSHTKQQIGTCASANAEQARTAIEAARSAFSGWRDTPARERAGCLTRAAAAMRRRRFELAAWEVHECGKPWREADADVAEAIDFCDYYAREMLRLAVPQRRDMPGEENATLYEPRGVVVVIAPWNFPLAILCGMTSAALVTGNTVVIKPAEQSSVVAAKLMEILQEAGILPGVLNYLPGVGEEIGPELIRHPDVAMIAFTGSMGVGLHINREAADTQAGQDHVKRVLAEMGGKNAIIVDSDADLDEAVVGVMHSAFGYQGQKCSACSRAVVLESIYEKFLGRLVEATRGLKIAPAEDPGCQVGPLIDADAKNRVLSYIEKGKAEARLAYAADPGELAKEGHYVGPHIIAEVPPSAVIAREEIFGPVLAVLKVKDLDEALRIANGVPYALTGGLYSRSPHSIERAKRGFRVGNLYINRKITGALVDRQPFGGFKLSGIGSKAGGPDYLLQFLLPRTITENTLRRGFAPDAAPAESPPAIAERVHPH
jgi:RHH-type transcriptional regulator, proline utilization regulon repressor / proline dehydrogenase / delta 1-pyrroline-5-carboxylate dehydrogenase